jgi:hypothetical protein
MPRKGVSRSSKTTHAYLYTLMGGCSCLRRVFGELADQFQDFRVMATPSFFLTWIVYPFLTVPIAPFRSRSHPVSPQWAFPRQTLSDHHILTTYAVHAKRSHCLDWRQICHGLTSRGREKPATLKRRVCDVCSCVLLSDGLLPAAQETRHVRQHPASSTALSCRTTPANTRPPNDPGPPGSPRLC